MKLKKKYIYKTCHCEKDNFFKYSLEENPRYYMTTFIGQVRVTIYVFKIFIKY